jgi:amidase
VTADDRSIPELIETSIARIEELDHSLHAVLALDPAAPAQAAALEAEQRDGRRRGPLHGVPILVKDNIDTAGVLATTAGSTALSGNVVGVDAPVVAALRRSGAIVLGKTNLSEWANFRSTRSASGWSAVGGLTGNPYALDRSAGGSSSGSGAAVAAGFAPAALGTETDGSILCPAALCGCVGLKPTAGLADRTGVVPISKSQDSVGPIARTVALAAAVLDAIAGGDHLAALAATPKGMRVGVARSISWGHHPLLDQACEEALGALAAAGVTVVDNVALEAPETLRDDEMSVLLHEFHAGIDAYLASHRLAGARNLAGLIEHNLREPDELAHFGQELFELAAATPALDSAQYLSARDRCRRAGRDDGIDAALASADLDAIAAPTYPPAWKSDLVNGDPHGRYSASQLPAVAGYPAITVPVGLVAGLPVGLALMGTARSERTLLRLAAAVEAAVGPLAPPSFRPPSPG